LQQTGQPPLYSIRLTIEQRLQRAVPQSVPQFIEETLNQNFGRLFDLPVRVYSLTIPPQQFHSPINSARREIRMR
jgi:hypothetical protein